MQGDHFSAISAQNGAGHKGKILPGVPAADVEASPPKVGLLSCLDGGDPITVT